MAAIMNLAVIFLGEHLMCHPVTKPSAFLLFKVGTLFSAFRFPVEGERDLEVKNKQQEEMQARCQLHTAAVLHF